MTQSPAARAVELLVQEANAALAETRYVAALSVAGRAMAAAEQFGDPSLLVRALRVEAGALRMLGDDAAALARYTRILGLAQDPAITTRLDGRATREVARAYPNWVAAARFAGGIPVRELFGVLDAAQRWLNATGHRDWRAAVLLQRSQVHDELGDWEQAVAAGQEALAAYRPDAPGPTLASYRFLLGNALRYARRSAEAEPLYQAILDDPASNARDRKVAWQGLAYCARDRGDPGVAVDCARAAMQLAEPLGDDSLTSALSALVAACRAVGDGEGACEAATRHLEAARRIGTHHRCYYAVRDAVDVALDRADHTAAAGLLVELERHALALDTDTHTTTRREETARRQQRLAQLDPHP